MSGVRMVTQKGQRSYPVVELVLGGQVVEARTGGVGVAAAASTKHLGIAIIDAQPATAVVTTPVADASGRYTLTAAALGTSTTVVRGGQEVDGVLFAAAASFGDRLVAAANGAVTPAGASPTSGTIIGHCSSLAGVAAGARGLVTVH